MKRLHNYLFWFVIGLSTAALIVVYVWRLWKLQFATTPDAFGLFGDYVGGVLGGLTGLVSVMFLYITYQKQIDIFNQQKQQAELQQFEQNFFRLLDNYKSILPRLKNKSDKTEGYEYIHSIRQLLEKPIDNICKADNALTELNALNTREKIDKIYYLAFGAESDQLGHYFRSLYHLLKYIKEHCPKDVDNKLYFDLVQAQMNTDELYLTCINGISNYGRKKLRPLLNESSILENLAIDENESIRRLVYFYYPKTQHKNPNGKRKNVILVAGTEGTEKGFLSKMLFAEQLPARITSVTGMLIRANCDPLDLKNNQHKLKVFMDKTLDPDDIYVISCNFCQLYPDGTNETLSLSVYEDLNPIAVVFLQTSIENMIQSVRYDNKIILDETTAELYLQNEETASSDYADLKDIPIFKYDVSDMPKAAEKIRSLVEKYS